MSSKQLKFADLRCNPSVSDAEAARLKPQAIAIYKALCRGALRTEQLIHFAAQYNARVKELRDWLRLLGNGVVPQQAEKAFRYLMAIHQKVKND
jgi:hypothetical protein